MAHWAGRSGPGPARLARALAPWLAGALVLAGLWAAAWPLLWQGLILPGARDAAPGLMVTRRAGVDGQGELLGRGMAPSSDPLKLDRAQGSLRAQAIWLAPASGWYEFAFTADDYGRLDLDHQPLIVFSPAMICLSEKRRLWLEAGPHLLVLGLTNLEGAGFAALRVAGPGRPQAAPLGPSELRALDLPHLPWWLEGLTWWGYACLLGLSACVLGMLRHLLGPYWPQLWEAGPRWTHWALLLAWLAALVQVGRVLGGLDLVWPAPGASLLWALGLLAAMAALAGSAWARLRDRPAGGRVQTLGALIALALLMRVAFLGNMEYKADEENMLYMALNLVRQSHLYLVGNLSSQGNYNPPAFLYLLGLPAALSSRPLVATLFIALLNTAAVGMTWVLARRLLGWWGAWVAALWLAVSPWAVRYAIKLWPQDCLLFFSLGLCLLLPAWAARGGWWRVLLVGAIASWLSQLHFTGLFLVAGLGLAGLPRGVRAPWGRLLATGLVFAALWLPYAWHQVREGSDGVSTATRFLSHLPRGELGHLWNAGRLLGGLGLDSPEVLGTSAARFQPWGRAGWEAAFHGAWLLALAGWLVWVRKGRRRPAPLAKEVDWLGLYLWGAGLALAGVVVMDLHPHPHYALFVLPWPMLLAGQAVQALAGGDDSPAGPWRRAALGGLAAGVLLVALAGASFFWTWQDHIGRQGGGGEYGPPYFQRMTAERSFVQHTRPLPGPGLETRWGR